MKRSIEFGKKSLENEAFLKYLIAEKYTAE